VAVILKIQQNRLMNYRKAIKKKEAISLRIERITFPLFLEIFFMFIYRLCCPDKVASCP
jgi:hypothetical protein